MIHQGDSGADFYVLLEGAVSRQPRPPAQDPQPLPCLQPAVRTLRDRCGIADDRRGSAGTSAHLLRVAGTLTFVPGGRAIGHPPACIAFLG